MYTKEQLSRSHSERPPEPPPRRLRQSVSRRETGAKKTDRIRSHIAISVDKVSLPSFAYWKSFH